MPRKNFSDEEPIVRRAPAGPEGRYAWTVTVGTKGQIVIPKEARELFHIQPGDHLLVLADKEKGMAIPPQEQFGQLFQAIFGSGKTE